ncbi:hypothetical protein G5V57_12810 [Nordella sp. HKS 07]|uniref:hypothetical protein n=1 Tax=Nordella sp. HKS 07 TaxID=2712222 RepID=UPI0013E1D7DB|nr:hypothetical protein [Nordella sp. HKS 07]QIG48528.1 hypothetical protein G5V57_12810 [Nordella sp. HKS 07]
MEVESGAVLPNEVLFERFEHFVRHLVPHNRLGFAGAERFEESGLPPRPISCRDSGASDISGYEATFGYWDIRLDMTFIAFSQQLTNRLCQLAYSVTTATRVTFSIA